MHSRSKLAAAAALAVAGLTASASAQYSLTVLHNNDGESSVLGDANRGNVAQFKTIVDETRSFYQGVGHGVVTLYAGDSIIPSPEFQASVNDGVFYDALALNAIGYDAAAIGNHEFDAGPKTFANFLDATTVPYLSANLDFSGETALAGRSDIGASTIVNVATAAGNKSVGIIGASTENLPFITSTGGVQVNPVAAAVNAEIAALQAQNVDNIVLVSHLQGIGTDLALLPQLNAGIDLVIAGGGDEILANLGAPSPTTVYGPTAPISVADTGLLGGDSVDQSAYPNLTAMDAGGNMVPVVAGGPNYGYLGRVTLDFDANGDLLGVDASSNPQINDGTAVADAGLLASVVNPVDSFVAGLESTVIATSSQFLAGNGDRDVIRAEEAGLGNLVADAYFAAAEANVGSFNLPVPDLAVVNGGGIRDDIGTPTGVGPFDVSLATTFDVSPFGNIVSIVEGVTADDLKLIFENAYSRTVDTDPGPGVEADRFGGDGTGRFLHVSEGVEVVYDITAQPLEVDDLDVDGDGVLREDGARIISLIVNGTVVVQDGVVVSTETFDIATADFLANGGDQIFNSGAFSYLSQDYTFTRVGISDQQGLQAYIEALAMGDNTFDLASDARYDAFADGRIIAIPEPATAGVLAIAGLVGLRRRR